MARMLGTCQRPWCPYCRAPAGLDCADSSCGKRSARAREKREWRREADLAAEFAAESLEWAEATFKAGVEGWPEYPG